MYPYIHITLPSYGVMAFIGGFFGITYLFFKMEKYKIEFLDLLKFFAAMILGGFIGSKLLFALTQIPWLISNFSVMNLITLIPRSGYVYYGGLFGVLGALWIAARKDNQKRQRVFKMIVPAIPLFHGFGRIGCMMAGCCYGVALKSHLYIGFIEFGRVPVQLIEALFEFILFGVFAALEKIDSKQYCLGNYLLLYAIFRFIIEFYRGDEVRGIWVFGLSTAQIISVLILIGVLISKKRNNNKNQLSLDSKGGEPDEIQLD